MKNTQTSELPEVRWDRLLRIKTAGRDDSSADQYRYPYEPTPYSVLERLGRIRTDPEGEYSFGLWLRQGEGRAFSVLSDPVPLHRRRI